MIELDKDNFDELVIESGELILVDFYSTGCEPCQALLPYVECLADEFQDRMKFYKFNITGGRRLAIRERVLGLPTIAVYYQGKKIHELVKDDATVDNIRAMIKDNLL